MYSITNNTTAIVNSSTTYPFISTTTSIPTTSLSPTNLNTTLVNGSINITSPPSTSKCPKSQDTDEDKVLKITGYCIMLVISLVGNILIITVILNNKKMKRPTNYFILNMAFSDLVVPLLILTRKITEINLGYSYGWAIDGDLGMVLCKVTYFLQDVSTAVSIVSLILITVDRFFAVVFPMKHYIMSGFVCKIAIAVSWLFGMGLHAIYLYTYDILISRNGLVCYNFWNKVDSPEKVKQKYFLPMFFLLAVTPFVIMATAYTIIYINLKRQSLPLGDSFTDLQRRQRALRERKVLLMAVAIVVSFALLWSPINIASFFGFFVYTSGESRPCWLNTMIYVGFYCAYANAAVNPCICFAFSENFRQGFRELLVRAGILSERRQNLGQQATQMSMTTQSRYNKAYDDQETKQDGS